ncbi:MAG: RHS repeat-associated core domain-containing protein, partial [Pyrinomonadaceae bacterium]
FVYNAAGAVSSMRLGNGKFENTQFNSRLQPTQIGLGSSANTQNLLKLNYGYGTNDNNGSVMSQIITVPTVGSSQGFTATQNYAYDSLNRIKQAAETIPSQMGWQQAFVYDRYGNRRFDTANTTTLAPGCAEAVCNPQVDPATNRLIGYQSDNAGNTKTEANGQTFIYDSENKQVQVNGSAGTIGQYFYDGDGKRIKKVVPSTGETTTFVYDAMAKLVAEYSTIVASPSEAKVAYLTNDPLGSPRITTDQFGQIISRRDFMPFGEEIARAGYGTDSIRQQFTGYERDTETDLDFAQARYFAYNHGRFTSPDDFFNDSQVSSPQSWNLYAYVRNNPLSFIDPTGMMTDFIDIGSGERKRIEDGKDQVIAAQSEDIKQFQKEFASDRGAYNQRLGVFESSANNLHMTNAQFDNLAGVIYAEASNNAPWTEAAGIHGVLRNRAAADETSVSDQATVANGIYGAGEKEKKKISDPNASTAKRNAVYKGLALSIVAFAVNGSDLSGGAYFWHGTDFRRPTAGSTAHQSFYRSGFQFTSPSHDIWNLGSRRSGNSRYDYKYQSTAAFGQTTFMKLTETWMKANGANTWRGTRR